MSRRFAKTLGAFLPLRCIEWRGEGRGEGERDELFFHDAKKSRAPFPLILTFSPKGEKGLRPATRIKSAGCRAAENYKSAKKLGAFLPLPLGGEGWGEVATPANLRLHFP